MIQEAITRLIKKEDLTYGVVEMVMEEIMK